MQSYWCVELLTGCLMLRQIVYIVHCSWRECRCHVWIHCEALESSRDLRNRRHPIFLLCNSRRHMKLLYAVLDPQLNAQPLREYLMTILGVAFNPQTCFWHVFLHPYFALLWSYRYRITITEVMVTVILLAACKCECNNCLERLICRNCQIVNPQLLLDNSDCPSNFRKTTLWLFCSRIFTARRYASAVHAVIVRPSVCPSVRHKSLFF